MTATATRTRAWRRSSGWLLTALVLLAAVAVGAGTGGTLALWRSEISGTVRMPVGVTVFGIGPPATPGTLAQYATADPQSLTFTFGKAQAVQLYGSPTTGGAVAVPIQVDSLAQGHRGLSYTVTPSISGGVFGASTWQLLKLAPGVACTTTATGQAVTSSTPWTTAYDATSSLRTEQWCLVARFVPITGTHENTASVTGTADVPDQPTPRTVTDTDKWQATVRQTLDPAAEPDHALTFRFSTSRPGGTP
ncbi:hypothetical protein [Cellulomonas dongxiuzhuiae]|uniref:hypothetical protein n=1 Tax=Cellulomonas dongxiuzhuiae TaxID=2819979 RepID=UPI001AAF918E|nr:hypothetical protein [Cellulomonas dongxiuzhuiae]MBO3088484.1 hypothetical protein [Cellulomonas dongxiuzhuiae]